MLKDERLLVLRKSSEVGGLNGHRFVRLMEAWSEGEKVGRI